MFEIKEFAPGMFRGPEPSEVEHYDTLQQAGIKVVIDLEARLLDLPGIKQEFIDWQTDRRGMILWPVPMLPVLPPRQSQLGLACHILWQAKCNKEPVYVHCRQGVDRTGMVVAAYKATYLLEPVEEVIADMKANGFHRRFFYWIPALREFCSPNIPE